MPVRGELAWRSCKFHVSGSKFPDNLKHQTSNLKPLTEMLHEQRFTNDAYCRNSGAAIALGYAASILLHM
jgi:hypothetical protein